MIGWIDVNDKLPDNQRRVLVFDKGGFGVGSGRRSSGGFWYFEGDRSYDDNITHWSELPDVTHL